MLKNGTLLGLIPKKIMNQNAKRRECCIAAQCTEYRATYKERKENFVEHDATMMMIMIGRK